MNYAFEIAGVGLTTQQRALDVIANNVANMNTVGFKRTDLRFSAIVAQRSDESALLSSLAREPALAGVTLKTSLALDVAGDIERTGRASDVAIDGEGFIELMGPRGQTLLWRGGSLKVLEDGLLATADGKPLRAAIAVPESATVLIIESDGVVKARQSAGGELTVLGQIPLVRADDADLVERLDGGLYAVADGAALSEIAAGDGNQSKFVQGGLERSNVVLNEEMVRLLIVQRAYGANAQIVQAADQLMAIINNLKR